MIMVATSPRDYNALELDKWGHLIQGTRELLWSTRDTALPADLTISIRNDDKMLEYEDSDDTDPERWTPCSTFDYCSGDGSKDDF